MSVFCQRCGETLASDSVCAKCGNDEAVSETAGGLRQPYRWMREDAPRPKAKPRPAEPPAATAAAAAAEKLPAPDKPAPFNEHLLSGVTPSYKMWSPGLAAFFSLLIPGWGQFYKGKKLAAVLWFIAVLSVYLILGWPGILLHLVCVAAAASGDSSRR